MKEILALASTLAELKERKKQLDAELKDLNQKIAETEEELSARMIEEEIQNFNHAGKTFYIQTKLYASPVAERKHELFAWLKANGFGDMVTESVNHNTLCAFIREQLEENNELPEDLAELVHVYEKTSVGMRKAS